MSRVAINVTVPVPLTATSELLVLSEILRPAASRLPLLASVIPSLKVTSPATPIPAFVALIVRFLRGCPARSLTMLSETAPLLLLPLVDVLIVKLRLRMTALTEPFVKVTEPAVLLSPSSVSTKTSEPICISPSKVSEPPSVRISELSAIAAAVTSRSDRTVVAPT